MDATYLGGRLLHGALSLLVLSAIVFACTQVLPGNAATVMLGDSARPEQLATLAHQLGLDRPVAAQYLDWLGRALRGDFGISTTLNQPVGAIIVDRLRNSAALALLTILVAAAIALPLGVLAALWRGRAGEAAILVFSYLGISIPDFVLGPVLIVTLAVPPLRLFPSNGFVPFGESPLRWLWHLALPAATLTLVLLAHLVRQTRSGVLEILDGGFARAARLRGLPERQVLLHHVLPSGLSTAIAVLAIDLGYLLGSIIIVEEVFAYPGVGRTLIYAILNRDLPLTQASTLLVGTSFVLSTLLADMAQRWLDPRL